MARKMTICMLALIVKPAAVTKGLASSCPDAMLLIPIRRVPRTTSQYLLRHRGGHGGKRDYSASATATPPASK
eukprot:scaffold191853_cov19-Tisochrysis_lutea.AAC.3